MKEQDKIADSYIEQCDWFVSNLNFEAMDYCIVFNTVTKKWKCKLLNKSFADIRDCQQCMKCK